MSEKIYLASIRYEVSIVEVAVEKETDKQYRVDGRNARVVYGDYGQYVGRVVFKEREGVCRSLREAHEWCLNALRRRREGLARQLDDTIREITELITVMGETNVRSDQS